MIANKYSIISKIGEGQFSNVYKGKYDRTNELVAIKTETIETPIPLLKHETRILNYINSKHSSFVPFVYWYGLYEHLPTLIMPLYDCSLEDYYNNISMSKKGCLLDILKIIEILSFIHECGVLHCDIKPDNFMIKQDNIYLIDFGLSCIYVDENLKPFPRKNDSIFITGTPKFISLNIHNGLSPSRRDDLISAIYIYIYFINNKNLLWLNVQDKRDSYSPNHINHFKNQERKRLKMEYYEHLNAKCIEKKLLEHLITTNFNEKPLYQWMLSLFREEIYKYDIC